MTAPQDLREALTLWVERDPKAPALRGMRGPWLSRGALLQRLEAGQQVLRRAGLRPGDRVALLMPQGLEGAIVSLQLASACTLAPLRPGLPSRQWSELLARLAPAALVLSPEVDPTIAAAAQEQGIPLIEPQQLLQAPAAVAPATAPSAAADDRSERCLVISSSGTTGLPKWVQLSQASVLRGCQAMARTLELTPADRTLLALPLHHVHGLVSCLVMPLITGGSVVVSDGFEASETIRLLGEQAITWISLPPAMHLALLDAYSRTRLAGGHRLRFLRSGAVSLPVSQIERLQAVFGVPVIEAYGMSECPHISSNPLAAPRAGSVGKPVVEELAIVDSEGRPLSAGQWGQVLVRGAPVMQGYLPTQHDHGGALIAGWLPSGDEGQLDADGYLHLRGRLQERINRGGLKVAPTVVDAALLSHADVREAVTFAIPHPTLGEDVAVAVVLRQGAEFDEQSLRRHAFRRLAPHEVPSTILRLDRIPLGSTGKPARRGMAERLAPLLQNEGDQAVDGLERLVAAAFAAVLERSVPGRQANFFTLGGDSLSGMRVIHQLERQLGTALEPTLLFQHPTAACLAGRLRQGRPGPGLEDSSEQPGQPRRPPIPAAPARPGDWPSGCLGFPASFAQARLWFLHQLQPDLCAYHLPALWRLNGRLDHAALDSALTALIERHTSLRSSFRPHGNAVVQIIHPSAPFRLPVETLAGRDPQQVLEDWLEQERSTPFDLTSGLLLRARLLAVTVDQHLLLINQHHIASDGWSCALFAQELAELYNAHSAHRAPQLQPLAVAYHDYAVWQRQRLTGSQRKALQHTWTQQLSGLEALDLPADHPRPATPSHRGGRVGFQVTPELLAPLEELCREEGATLQMGLLSLVALLLHRYSRQDDFAIGVPIWGRNHPDLEPLIGCFVNMLPIRTRFVSDQSFRQLLLQVRDTSIAAYGQQELPFEEMVEALRPERDTSRNPLVQVVLQLLNVPPASLQTLSGLCAEPLSPAGLADACRFDLEFLLRPSESGGLHGQILYATDLFREERLQRLSDHLLTLWASALQAPDAPANAFRLLPDDERALIESWQQGPSIEIAELGVHQLFEQQVQHTPEAIALSFEDQQLSYRELNARANLLAQRLAELGVAAEAIVAVCLERSLELIVALLAILKAGGAYLALDPGWPQARQQQLIAQARCCLRIDGDGMTPLQSQPEASESMAPWTTGALRPDRQTPGEQATALGSTGSGSTASPALAYISFTSGSTGVPKGVAIPHAAILRLVHPVNGFRLGPDSRVLQLAPVAFDASTFEIWGPLLQGGTLVIAPPGRLSTSEIGVLLRRHRISCLWLTAGLFHAMVDDALADLASVSQVLAGGDVLAPDSVQRLLHAFPADHQLINGYGPTENTTFSCCHRLQGGSTLRPGTVPIGRPIAASSVRVLEASGQLCPIGIPGELHLGGAGLARGYLHDPERTAAAFILDPCGVDPGLRLYKSGDLVSWNADGSLAFHGRMDQQIKLRGFRLEPAEIEAQLLSHSAVAQAAVVLRRDNRCEPMVVAYWVAQYHQRAAAASELDLRGFLQQRLPEVMVPAAFVALEALPLTRNGKLDRSALPAPAAVAAQRPGLPPGDALQRQLHGLWSEVLGHGAFGVEDNFFQVGGHSLAAARLATLIQRQGPQPLSVAQIFVYPSIGEQAAYLAGRQPTQQPANLVSLQSQGERNPLYLIHGWGGGVGNFVALANALAPRRPVFGIQANAYNQGQLEGPSEPVRVMAASYAEQILERHGAGPIHLLGYSGGGWYAFAVAEALLERGATIGLLALLDTHASARIHRRLGLRLMAHRAMHGMGPSITALAQPPAGQGRRQLLLEQLRSFNGQLDAYFGWRIPPVHRLITGALHRPTPSVPTSPYIQWLRKTYRPPRLPLTVDVFATPTSLALLAQIWSFYATRGVRLHPLFADHFDFMDAARMPELAAALEAALAPLERG